MKKSTIITDFSPLTDAELDIQGHTVDTAMTNNPRFPDLSDEVSRVHAASIEYSMALASLAIGAPVAKAIKDACRVSLIRAMRVLGIRINLDAAGDETKLRTTGFPLAGSGAPIGAFPKPEGFSVTPVIGVHGSMKLKVKPVYGARGYSYQYAMTPVTPESIWTNCFCTKATCLITGLESRKEYAFRVAAIGTDPSVTFSDEIRSNVL